MLRYKYKGEKYTCLSLRLSKVLGNEYGLKTRNETKVTQLIGQYLEQQFVNSKSITSGGRTECSALDPDSDTDVMGVISRYLVVDNDNYSDESNVYISMNRTGCYPGYCKLTLSSDQYSKLETLSRYNYIDIGIRKSVITQPKSSYLSSEMFNQHVIPPGLIPADNFTDESVQINGPAKTNMNVDYVQSFEMGAWPEEAKKWKSRQRRNNWPNEKLLDKLGSEVPCYVVPTGNKTSSCFDLEWRLSFVEIERELIWSMNDTQFKSYVLLKFAKKRFFQSDIILKQISSYHMKNILFWMCEELPESEWVPENLLSCVKTGLKMLELCILHWNNANYFVPENNLFHSMTFSSKEKKDTISALQTVWSVCLMAWNNMLVLDGQLNSIDVPCEVHEYVHRCNIVFGLYTYPKNSSFITNFRTTFLEADLLLPSIHIARALAQLNLMDNVNSRLTTDKDIIVETAVESIRKGNAIDYMTATLYIAIVYFMHDKTDKVINVLKPVLSNNHQKLYISSLGVPTFINLKSGEMNDKCNDANCKVKDIWHDRKHLVMHFSVEYHRKDMLPYPFRLQLCITGPRALYNCNPLVVSYYLLYMSEFQCGTSTMKETRCLFEKAVSNSSHQKNYFLHLGLLGYCYYASGDNEAAYKCYAKSVIIKPSVINVAVYLLAILLNDEYRKK